MPPDFGAPTSPSQEPKGGRVISWAHVLAGRRRILNTLWRQPVIHHHSLATFEPQVWKPSGCYPIMHAATGYAMIGHRNKVMTALAAGLLGSRKSTLR